MLNTKQAGNGLKTCLKKSCIPIFRKRASNSLFCSEFGEISREISSVTQVACMSIFVGAVYGGINSSKETYIDFIKNNQATAFKNPFEAKVLFRKHNRMYFYFDLYRGNYETQLV